MAIPVLEGALDRSLQLASSMDARGYGRRVSVSRSTRRLTGGATVSGLLLVVVGVYGVLDPDSLPAGGVPFLAVGALLVGVGLVAGGRRTNRTRYRPDVWGVPEGLVVGAGALVLLAMVAASVLGVAGLQLVVSPLHAPTVPLLPAVGILFGLVPAVAAPVPADPVVVRSGSHRPRPSGAENAGEVAEAAADAVAPPGRATA
jgi:energy-coupling factor transport system permease protein